MTDSLAKDAQAWLDTLSLPQDAHEVLRILKYTLGCVLVCTLFLGITAQGHAQTLPDDIDISVTANGIVALPPTVDSVFTNVFERYTKIVAPNGQRSIS
jgi:hypothetical protein